MIVECHCDDGTLPPDGYLAQFSANSRICCDSFGTPVDDPLRWKGWLEERGFVSVTEKPLKLPCSPWPKDPRLKLVGAFEMDHFRLPPLHPLFFFRALARSNRSQPPAPSSPCLLLEENRVDSPIGPHHAHYSRSNGPHLDKAANPGSFAVSNSTGLSATPFRRILGWSPERITTLIEGAKKEVKNMRHHGYWPL